ncbi:hypothetical protein EDD11_006716 [Mortierella claussenii]|nr:hypothetical protein EDD11_006716 [Mortierella claussenii]
MESGDYDLSQDHPGYHLPVSNVPYHVYAEDRYSSETDAVEQRAFQRIMDSYEEYERLADVFQVELDRRQELVNERREREKLQREERQRQLKEEKRIKKMGKSRAAAELAAQAQAELVMPSRSRTSPHPYHPYRSSSQYTAAPAAAGASHPDSVGYKHSSHGRGHDPDYSSGYRYGYGSSSSGYGQRSVFSSPSDPHSNLNLDHPPQLIRGSAHAVERSLTNSPVLPLTPSPRLRATDSGLGMDTLVSTAATTGSASSSASATPFSLFGSSSSTFATSHCSETQQQQCHPLIPSIRMRKKRKQAVPVHPSVVDRIPGITLRIQPDAEQYLQVEILKNVEDYRTMKDVPTASSMEAAPDTRAQHDKGDEESGGNIDSNDQDAQKQQHQEKQDLDKIRESIESGWPGYAFFPSSSADAVQSMFAPESTLPLETTEAIGMYDLKSELRHQRQHYRHSSTASSSSRSLDFLDPTGARLSNAAAAVDDQYRSRSISTSTNSLPWAAMSLHSTTQHWSMEDATAAISTLPLSWDNFSSRDCQVNKVIGHRDREFELLEEVVQEAVARQHATAHQSPEELETSVADKAVSHHHHRRAAQSSQDRESSAANGSTKSGRIRGASLTSSKNYNDPTTSASSKTTAATSTSSSRQQGVRATRGGATELVQGYDDIERILKEKRQRKREEKQRRENIDRMTSEPVTESGHESDRDQDEERQGVKNQSVDGDGDYSMRDDDGDNDDSEHEEKGSCMLESEESAQRKRFSQRHKKSLVISAAAHSPPSPPRSRQVTPCKNDSTATSRRSSFSFSTAHIQPVPYTSAAGTGAAHGPDVSSTPPATPTRVLPPPPLFTAHDRHTAAVATAAALSGAKMRRRSRSISNSAISEEGKTAPEEEMSLQSSKGKNQNHFFDFQLELIAAKEKEKREKKRKASAAAAAAAAAVATQEEKEEAFKMTRERQDEEEQGYYHDGDGHTMTSMDPHELERELDHLSSSTQDPKLSSNSNLPASSKYLPGRVLRKARTKTQDPLYVTDSQVSSSGPGSGAGQHESKSVEGERRAAEGSEEVLDPDCTSCRLAVSELDRALWKQARQAGEIQLNPKRWGKSTILCNRCRTEYQKHHLRCTQCFYVPAVVEGEKEAMLGRPGLSRPKAGGTCTRCKAGTWFQEAEH